SVVSVTPVHAQLVNSTNSTASAALNSTKSVLNSTLSSPGNNTSLVNSTSLQNTTSLTNATSLQNTTSPSNVTSLQNTTSSSNATSLQNTTSSSNATSLQNSHPPTAVPIGPSPSPDSSPHIAIALPEPVQLRIINNSI